MEACQTDDNRCAYLKFLNDCIYIWTADININIFAIQILTNWCFYLTVSIEKTLFKKINKFKESQNVKSIRDYSVVIKPQKRQPNIKSQLKNKFPQLERQ